MNSRQQRKRRIKSKVKGIKGVPRLSVFRSLKSVYCQIINDERGETLAQANLKEAKAKNTVEGAKKIGKLIAEKCLAKRIEKVVFDRGGYKYHGKVKALAEGARAGGLKF